MTSDSSDKVKREIEELLDNLDTFVPEQRLASKIRDRQRRSEGPGVGERIGAQVRRVTLGHVMLAGLALLLLSWFPVPYEGWLTLAGIALAGTAFVLSVARRGGGRTPVVRRGGPEKRWRGQPIDYNEPSVADRVRSWWRGRRRR